MTNAQPTNTAPITTSTTPTTATISTNEASVIAPAPKPEAELQSEKFAAFAKKEQQVVQERMALKKQREELAAQQKELATKLTPFQEFEAMKSKDPVAALRGLGFTETDIFNWLANGEKKELTPEEIAKNAAKAELDNFKKEQADIAAKQEVERNNQVLTQFRGNIKNFLIKNAEKYEACADYGDVAVDTAFKIIAQVAKDSDGEIISLDEAFQTLEDFYDGEYKRMSNYKKFKAAEATQAAAAQGAPREMPQRSRQLAKTITNTVTTTAATQARMPTGESKEQKRDRLINMLRNGAKL